MSAINRVQNNSITNQTVEKPKPRGSWMSTIRKAALIGLSVMVGFTAGAAMAVEPNPNAFNSISFTDCANRCLTTRVDQYNRNCLKLDARKRGICEKTNGQFECLQQNLMPEECVRDTNWCWGHCEWYFPLSPRE